MMSGGSCVNSVAYLLICSLTQFCCAVPMLFISEHTLLCARPLSPPFCIQRSLFSDSSEGVQKCCMEFSETEHQRNGQTKKETEGLHLLWRAGV